MTVRDIVKNYLKDNQYDGLFMDECACTLDDLIPCCGYVAALNCEPGVKVPCDGSCESGKCDFHIAAKPAKPAKPAAKPGLTGEADWLPDDFSTIL